MNGLYESAPELFKVVSFDSSGQALAGLSHPIWPGLHPIDILMPAHNRAMRVLVLVSAAIMSVVAGLYCRAERYAGPGHPASRLKGAVPT